MWKDINLAELLKFAWSKDGSALPKRDAAEVLVEMSSRLKDPIPITSSKLIASEMYAWNAIYLSNHVIVRTVTLVLRTSNFAACLSSSCSMSDKIQSFRDHF